MDIKLLTVEGALAIINDPNNTFGVDKKLLTELMSLAIKDEMEKMQRTYGVASGLDDSAYKEVTEELWSEPDTSRELYDESEVDTPETDLFARYNRKGR